MREKENGNGQEMHSRMERDKGEKKQKRNRVYSVLFLACIAIFLFSLGKLVGILLDYKDVSDFYDAAAEEFTLPQIEVPEIEENKPPVEVDFHKLLSINEDIIGWIYMDDTVVNYPILQGDDNFYYLNRSYYKKYLVAGSIYLDTGNDRQLGDKHSVIYGHNMKNHTMFGDMDDFMKAKYLKKHPYVDILLPDGTWLRYEIFSVYRAGVEDGTYDVPLNEKKELPAFLKVAKEKNMYKDQSDLSLPKVTSRDRVLTLSTCTEDSSDTERFVVTAVLIEKDGEPVKTEEE